MSERLHDPALVVLSLAVVLLLVLGARALGRSNRLAPPALRKLLHAAVGAWTLLITPHFHSLWWAISPPILFGVVNFSGYARTLMPNLGATSWETRGLWTFPLGVALTYLLFWGEGERRAILSGLAALAFADPLAAVVGTRFGQRTLRGFGHGRTLEGSATFFLVAAIAVGLIASGQAGGAFAWRMGIACGAAGAAAEAATPSGWDNVTIPLSVALLYEFLG